MRISDWSADVCSSDLPTDLNARTGELTPPGSSDCARANRAWERSVFMFLLLHRRPPRVREPNFPWLLLQERLQPRSFRPEASRVVAAGTVSSPSSATRSGSRDSESAPPAKHAHYARAAATGSGASKTPLLTATMSAPAQDGRAEGRERVCHYE